MLTLSEGRMKYSFLDLAKKGREKAKPTNGGVAQLGEHLPCKQGVMGSNPIISTKDKKS